MGQKSDKKFIVKGKRLDGRKPDEIRPVSVKVGVIPQADGSAEVSMGETTAIAAVYGPQKVHPRRFEVADRAYIRLIYDMASFSVSDRKRPGPSRRSKEISKVMKEALAPAIYLEKYPQMGIYIYVEIINANAGTRTAAINAASVALADAGIEMRDLVTSVAAGKVDNKIVVDLLQDEDNYGQADLPVAFMPNSDKITLIQMDGNLTKKELEECLKLCKKASKKIYDVQKKALVDKYKQVGVSK